MEEVELSCIAHIIHERRKVAVTKNDKKHGRLEWRCSAPACTFLARWGRVRGVDHCREVPEPLAILLSSSLR
jgi:hypothetical protein